MICAIRPRVQFSRSLFALRLLLVPNSCAANPKAVSAAFRLAVYTINPLVLEAVTFFPLSRRETSTCPISRRKI